MIADGRMPTPEQAKQARKARLEARHARPAEITRRQQRQEADRLLHVHTDADFCEREAAPMWEVLDQALDLTDPELWKSNSFAVVRTRLVIALQAYIAKVEYDGSRGGSWAVAAARGRATPRPCQAASCGVGCGPLQWTHSRAAGGDDDLWCKRDQLRLGMNGAV